MMTKGKLMAAMIMGLMPVANPVHVEAVADVISNPFTFQDLSKCGKGPQRKRNKRRC